MATEYLPGKTYHPGTIARELRTLAQAFDAVGIPAPELPDLGRIYVPGEVWYDAAQQRALVQACHPGYRDHVILYLQMGLRAGELYQLDQPDFARMTVRVRGTKTPRSDRTVCRPRRQKWTQRTRREAGPMGKPPRNYSFQPHRGAGTLALLRRESKRIVE
jgi:integrase